MNNDGIRLTTQFNGPFDEIKAILEEEANVLARVIDDKSLVGMPPRVELAVRREIVRLRNLAAKVNPPEVLEEA